LDTSDTPLERRNIRAVLEAALACGADQPALRGPGQTLTYAEVWTEGLKLGLGLGELGVERQQPVLLMLDNHPDNVLCWAGVSLTGLVEVSINTAYKGDMLAHIIRDSGARVLIADATYVERLANVAKDVPALATVVVRGATEAALASAGAVPWLWLDFDALRAETPAEPAELQPWDLASISYTSGTTGRSKGVLCPHAHAFGHGTIEGLGRTRPGETRFIVLPQFHIAGRWGGVLSAFASRGTAYIAPAFHASTFWDEAKAAGARSSQLVGTMAEFLMRCPPGPGDRDHGVREIGVIPLPKNLAAFEDRFGVKVRTAYGSTELGSVVDSADPAPGSVGRARDGYEIRIVDEHDLEVPAGVVGELVARPTMPWTSSLGYHNHPEKTVEAWRNGWLHSGDALKKDEDGNFFFVDRVDDSLRRRGENISSSEVEYLINAHPHVQESAVVGVSSEFLEDELKAVIILRASGSITELQLLTELAETMPYFMVPRYVHFVEDLPRTPTAKVQKGQLRATGTAGAWDREAAGFKLKR
jgi:crotonobetaine/carnitine-CoA ligase